MRQLSDDEISILTLVARGHTNAEIGRKMGRSAENIKYQLRGVYAALHARDRAHATAIAYHVGIFKGRDL